MGKAAWPVLTVVARCVGRQLHQLFVDAGVIHDAEETFGQAGLPAAGACAGTWFHGSPLSHAVAGRPENPLGVLHHLRRAAIAVADH